MNLKLKIVFTLFLVVILSLSIMNVSALEGKESSVKESSSSGGESEAAAKSSSSSSSGSSDSGSSSLGEVSKTKSAPSSGDSGESSSSSSMSKSVSSPSSSTSEDSYSSDKSVGLRDTQSSSSDDSSSTQKDVKSLSIINDGEDSSNDNGKLVSGSSVLSTDDEDDNQIVETLDLGDDDSPNHNDEDVVESGAVLLGDDEDDNHIVETLDLGDEESTDDGDEESSFFETFFSPFASLFTEEEALTLDEEEFVETMVLPQFNDDVYGEEIAIYSTRFDLKGGNTDFVGTVSLVNNYFGDILDSTYSGGYGVKLKGMLSVNKIRFSYDDEEGSYEFVGITTGEDSSVYEILLTFSSDEEALLFYQNILETIQATEGSRESFISIYSAPFGEGEDKYCRELGTGSERRSCVFSVEDNSVNIDMEVPA